MIHLIHVIGIVVTGERAGGGGTAEPHSGFQWHYFALFTTVGTLEPTAWGFVNMSYNRLAHLNELEREKEAEKENEEESILERLFLRQSLIYFRHCSWLSI